MWGVLKSVTISVVIGCCISTRVYQKWSSKGLFQDDVNFLEIPRFICIILKGHKN